MRFLSASPLGTRPWARRLASAGTPTFLDGAAKHADITLSGSNLIATRTADSGTPAWASVRSTVARTSGRYYFEAKYFAGTNCIAGLMNGSMAFDNYPGSTADSCGWDKLGNYYQTGSSVGVFAGFNNNDWAGLDVDLTNDTISIRNITAAGAWQTPRALPTGLQGANAVYAAVAMSDLNDTLTVNFGASAFAGTIPSGATSWDGSQVG